MREKTTFYLSMIRIRLEKAVNGSPSTILVLSHIPTTSVGGAGLHLVPPARQLTCSRHLRARRT